MSILTRMLIYNATYAVGAVLMLLTVIISSKTYGISRMRAAVYAVLSFGAGIGGANLIGAVYNALWSLKGIETDIKVDMLGAMIFTLFFLLAVIPAEKGVRKRMSAKPGGREIKPVSFRDTMDMIIPGAFLVFTCIKLGCHIRGCCYGVPWEHGVRSPMGDIRLFPVQLCEFASLCAILIICSFIKRTKLYRRGMAAPLTAFMYGAARFCWEYARYYTPEMKHFASGLSLWQLFSLLVIVVTAIWLAVLVKTQPPEPLPELKIISLRKTADAVKNDTKSKGGTNNKTQKQRKSKK